MTKVIGFTAKTSLEGQIIIYDSTDRGLVTNDINRLLEWLCQPPEGLACFWKLDQTVELIKALLSPWHKEKLTKTSRCFVRPYNLFYSPGKILSIRLGMWEYPYYNLSQFFPDSNPQSASEVAGKGQELLDSLRSIGFYPTRLTSGAGIGQEMILDHLSLPTYKDIPEEAVDYASDCYPRTWIEAHKLGHFEQAQDWDITYSFPWAASQLLDTRYCQWVKADYYVKGAVYGYCKGAVTIDKDVKTSPICYTTLDKGDIHPTGTWKDTLTLDEIRLIKTYKLGSFGLKDGWFCVPRLVIKPLEAVVNRLYKHKDNGSLAGRLAKQIAVGTFYGKFAQIQPDARGELKPGKFFNPVYACQIETQVRCKVARFIYAHGLEPIHIWVDGLLCEPKELDIRQSSVPGSWRLAGIEPALVLGSGLCFHSDKRPEQWSYEELMEAIRSKPKDAYYQKGSKGIYIQQEHDRLFSRLPVSGSSLLEHQYTSRPVEVD